MVRKHELSKRRSLDSPPCLLQSLFAYVPQSPRNLQLHPSPATVVLMWHPSSPCNPAAGTPTSAGTVCAQSHQCIPGRALPHINTPALYSVHHSRTMLTICHAYTHVPLGFSKAYYHLDNIPPNHNDFAMPAAPPMQQVLACVHPRPLRVLYTVKPLDTHHGRTMLTSAARAALVCATSSTVAADPIPPTAAPEPPTGACTCLGAPPTAPSAPASCMSTSAPLAAPTPLVCMPPLAASDPPASVAGVSAAPVEAPEVPLEAGASVGLASGLAKP